MHVLGLLCLIGGIVAVTYLALPWCHHKGN